MERTEPQGPSPENAAQFASAAVEVSKEIYGYDLDYSPASLQRVDEMVDKFRASGHSLPRAESALFALGCYVGEVMVRNAGARWCTREEVGAEKTCSFPILIQMSPTQTCNPIGKVYKRMSNGAEDSVVDLYGVVCTLQHAQPLFDHVPTASPETPSSDPPKPWWKFW